MHQYTQVLRRGDAIRGNSNAFQSGCKSTSCLLVCVQVSEVLYAATAGLKYLLLRLGDGVTRQQLEAIQPNMAAMQAAASVDDVRGVILTIPGG